MTQVSAFSAGLFYWRAGSLPATALPIGAPHVSATEIFREASG
jgi:hypothetical protein